MVRRKNTKGMVVFFELMKLWADGFPTIFKNEYEVSLVTKSKFKCRFIAKRKEIDEIINVKLIQEINKLIVSLLELNDIIKTTKSYIATRLQYLSFLLGYVCILFVKIKCICQTYYSFRVYPYEVDCRTIFKIEIGNIVSYFNKSEKNPYLHFDSQLHLLNNIHYVNYLRGPPNRNCD